MSACSFVCLCVLMCVRVHVGNCLCAYVCACLCMCVSGCVFPVVSRLCVCDAVCLAVCMCMCACAHKCARPRVCERGAVCVCDVAHVDMGKRVHVCAPLHVPVCAVVCGMVCARRHTAHASRASRQSHLTASPVYESSEGREESAYDDRMSLEHLCATCRAACAHARRASDHSCQPAAARSAWRRLQSLHLLLTRRWAQMEAPQLAVQLRLRQNALGKQLLGLPHCFACLPE